MALSLFGTEPTSVDSNLASLFSSSSGPIKKAPKAGKAEKKRSQSENSVTVSALDDVENAPAVKGSESVTTVAEKMKKKERSSRNASSEGALEELAASVVDLERPEKRRRKRKRNNDDDLESTYLQKLSREEEQEEQQRQAERASKKSKVEVVKPLGEDETPTEAQVAVSSDVDDEDEDDYVIPKHETLGGDEPTDLEKASRTIFVGNVATSAITSKANKKILTAHLSSFFAELPKSDPPHKIESFRFRSTAFASAIPKKAAFATQDLKEATTKSTNAYVVYSTKHAAREAAKRLNGTVVLDRHIRVDEVAHPAVVDHHRCVFVGNLGFVDDETQMKAGDAAQGHGTRKAQNGDVEEGLWRQFGNAGAVESVRVVRDPKTRVGKGFAYVQFKDENAVEAALLFNDKRFPPLLPRKLRVVRAKKFKRNQTGAKENGNPNKMRVQSKRRPAKGASDEVKSLTGRVRKLLGRAGAANVDSKAFASSGKPLRTPESFVFEGHRATKSQGNQGLKLGRSGKKKVGKPTNRGAKRGSAWKAQQGGKK